MQPHGASLVVKALAHVLGEIARRHTRLLERAGTMRQIADQLDVHDPAAPHVPDQPLAHVPADREVHVQPMPARMPLRCPRIRQRLAAKLVPQPANGPRTPAARVAQPDPEDHDPSTPTGSVPP